jgi:hypothetical protein
MAARWKTVDWVGVDISALPRLWLAGGQGPANEFVSRFAEGVGSDPAQGRRSAVRASFCHQSSCQVR